MSGNKVFTACDKISLAGNKVSTAIAPGNRPNTAITPGNKVSIPRPVTDVRMEVLAMYEFYAAIQLAYHSYNTFEVRRFLKKALRSEL
jgi:hypothetical protein